jgi:hypothetical protein
MITQMKVSTVVAFQEKVPFQILQQRVDHLTKMELYRRATILKMMLTMKTNLFLKELIKRKIRK